MFKNLLVFVQEKIENVIRRKENVSLKSWNILGFTTLVMAFALLLPWPYICTMMLTTFLGCYQIMPAATQLISNLISTNSLVQRSYCDCRSCSRDLKAVALLSLVIIPQPGPPVYLVFILLINFILTRNSEGCTYTFYTTYFCVLLGDRILNQSQDSP